MADKESVNAAEYRKQIDVIYTNALIDLQANSPDSAEYKNALESAFEYGLLYTSVGKCVTKEDLAANEMILASPDFRASSLNETAFLRITKEPAGSKLVSFGEALDFMGVERPKMPEEPKKPRRGFFGTIRDMLFGKNNAGRREYDNKVASYNRQMRRYEEVCDAKIKNVLETKLGMSVPEYDKVLLNDELANEYVKNNVSLAAAHEAEKKRNPPEAEAKEPEKKADPEDRNNIENEKEKEKDSLKIEDDNELKADGPELVLQNEPKPEKEKEQKQPEPEANEAENKAPETVVNSRNNNVRSESGEIRIPYRRGAEEISSAEEIGSTDTVINDDTEMKTLRIDEEIGNVEGNPVYAVGANGNGEWSNDEYYERVNKWNEELGAKLSADSFGIYSDAERKNPLGKLTADELLNQGKALYASASEDGEVYRFIVDKKGNLEFGSELGSSVNEWSETLEEEFIEEANNDDIRIYSAESGGEPLDMTDAYALFRNGKTLYAGAEDSEKTYRLGIDGNGGLLFGKKFDDAVNVWKSGVDAGIRDSLRLKDNAPVSIFASADRGEPLNEYDAHMLLMDGRTLYAGAEGSYEVFALGVDKNGIPTLGNKVDEISRWKDELGTKIAASEGKNVGNEVKKAEDIKLFADSVSESGEHIRKAVDFPEANELLKAGSVLYASENGSSDMHRFRVFQNGRVASDGELDAYGRMNEELGDILAMKYSTGKTIVRSGNEEAKQKAKAEGKTVSYLGVVNIFADKDFEKPITEIEAFDLLNGGKRIYASAGDEETGFEVAFNKDKKVVAGRPTNIKGAILSKAIARELSSALNTDIREFSLYQDKQRNAYINMNSAINGLDDGRTFYASAKGSNEIFPLKLDSRGSLIFGNKFADALDSEKQFDRELKEQFGKALGTDDGPIGDIRIYSDMECNTQLSVEKAYEELKNDGTTLYATADDEEEVFEIGRDKNGDLAVPSPVHPEKYRYSAIVSMIDGNAELSKLARSDSVKNVFGSNEIFPKKARTILEKKSNDLNALSETESDHIKKSLDDWLKENGGKLVSDYRKKSILSTTVYSEDAAEYLGNLDGQTLFNILKTRQAEIKTELEMEKRMNGPAQQKAEDPEEQKTAPQDPEAKEDSRAAEKKPEMSDKEKLGQMMIDSMRTAAYQDLAKTNASPEAVIDSIAKIMVCHGFSAKSDYEIDFISHGGSDVQTVEKLRKANVQSRSARESLADGTAPYENAVKQVKNTPAFRYYANEYLKNPNKSTFLGTQRGILEVRGLMEKRPIGAVEGLKAQSVAAEAMLVKSFNEKNVSLSKGKKASEATMDKILSASNESANLTNAK